MYEKQWFSCCNKISSQSFNSILHIEHVHVYTNKELYIIAQPQPQYSTIHKVTQIQHQLSELWKIKQSNNIRLLYSWLWSHRAPFTVHTTWEWFIHCLLIARRIQFKLLCDWPIHETFLQICVILSHIKFIMKNEKYHPIAVFCMLSSLHIKSDLGTFFWVNIVESVFFSLCASKDTKKIVPKLIPMFIFINDEFR